MESISQTSRAKNCYSSHCDEILNEASALINTYFIYSCKITLIVNYVINNNVAYYLYDKEPRNLNSVIDWKSLKRAKYFWLISFILLNYTVIK